MPTISLTDDELAAVAAAIRGLVEADRYPLSPRLDPLRAALGKWNAAAQEPTSLSKAPPPAQADKRRGDNRRLGHARSRSYLSRAPRLGRQARGKRLAQLSRGRRTAPVPRNGGATAGALARRVHVGEGVVSGCYQRAAAAQLAQVFKSRFSANGRK